LPQPDVPTDTPPDPTCGNGKIDPGELCYLPRVGYPSHIHPCGVALADVDNDGHTDMVATNDVVSQISVIRNAGALSFGAPIPIEVGAMPVMSTLADIDNDGDLDIATTNNTSNKIRVTLGHGDGTFDPPTSYSVSGPWEPLFADINADGILDMLATTQNDSQIYVWFGAGNGTFVVSGGLATDTTPMGVVAVDLDANGWADLLSANYVGTITVYLADGVGGLKRLDDVAAGGALWSITSGDFNSDGLVDVAVADELNAVHILIGDGKGGLESKATYGVGIQPSSVRPGDLNEDGVPDFATSDQLSNEVGVLLSNP
jgi:hypothetical protein